MMSIEWQILGRAGADNALHVTVDSGQSRESFLFDCGERVLDSLRPGEIQSIAHIGFSHFHMDHVAGFDGFFRLNYNRPETPVTTWGPAGAIDLMGHRFQGFVWNLHADQPGEWIVHEISPEKIATSHFLTHEAFATAHSKPDRRRDSASIQQGGSWRLEARLLPHGSIDSVAYRIVESPKRNIDPAAMRYHDYLPGPWLRTISDEAEDDEALVEIAGHSLRVGELRRELLVTSPGSSIAYLTDFRVEPNTEAWSGLVEWLSGTTTLVCECQYRSTDAALAVKNAHMTADLVGRLAADASVGHLVLQHLSRRYQASDWLEMRDEAGKSFPRAEFPPHWEIV